MPVPREYLQGAGAGSSGGTEVVDHARAVAHRVRFPHAVGLAGAAAALMVTLGLSSDLARPAELPPADPAEAVTIADTGALVDRSLVGTGAVPTPGVTAAACAGAALPLSLPAGSTPTGATLVRAEGVGNRPGTVDPATAAGWATVPERERRAGR